MIKMMMLILIGLSLHYSSSHMIRIQRVFLSNSKSGPLPEFNGLVSVYFTNPKNESEQLKNTFRASYDLTSAYSFIAKPSATTDGVEKTFLFNKDKHRYTCDKSDTCEYQNQQDYV